MSESQAQSRDELIARRDEIIIQLQGTWKSKKFFTVINLNALKAAAVIGVAGFLLAFVGSVLGIAFNLAIGNDLGHFKIADLFGLVALLVIGYMGIAFAVMWIVGVVRSKSADIEINGTVFQLIQKDRSEISLHHLTHYWMPHDEESDREDSRASLSPLWVGHMLERWDLNRYWLYPIRIRPMAYQQGQELVRLLDQVATLNNALEKLRESDG